MDGLHDGDECAEGKIGNTGERCLQHHGKCSQLQCYDTADDGCGNDAGALRAFPLAEPVAAHNGTPNEVISHEASVERHVPDVGSQSHESSVGKEQTLDRKDHDHGQESAIGSQKCREHHAAAHVAGRTGPGNGIVDHLAGKDQSRRHRHGRQFLLLIVRRARKALVYASCGIDLQKVVCNFLDRFPRT